MPNVEVKRIPVSNAGQPQVLSHTTLGVTAAAGPALRRLLFITPYACTLQGAKLTAYATIAANGNDYWSFLLEKLDGTDLTSALTTETVLTAGVPRSFTLVTTSGTNVLAAGTPIYLSMGDTGSPSDLDAAHFNVQVQFIPS